ncbi:MAG TPA: hypothetical protein VJL84_10010 [Kiloniellales bacterium]|nr:hypothetical protein [Kiloniellales bacterium]
MRTVLAHGAATALAACLSVSPALSADGLADRAECFRQAMATYLEMPVAFPEAPSELPNGGFTLHEVQLKLGPGDADVGKILSLDVYAFDCAGFQQSGAPKELKLHVGGASVPPALHPLAKMLPGMALDDYIDVDLDLAYDAASKRLTLRQADAVFTGVASLRVAVDATGIDLATARVTGQGLLGLGMTLAGASIHRLSATLENYAGNRFLEAIARAQGMTMVALRDSWVKQLDDMAATEGKEAAVPYLRELKAFVLDMRRLTVRLSPPAGHVDSTILAAHGDSVAEQIAIAGLSVEANR